MELSFVISALKKRFWVIALFAILGFLIGVLSTPKDQTWTSSVGLVVRQPIGGNQDPDRYLATEINVIRSSIFIKETADRFNGLDFVDIAESIDIEQRPETDNVLIVATHKDKNLPIDIANIYAEAYISSIEQGSSNVKETEKLEQELGDQDNPVEDTLYFDMQQINSEIARKLDSDTVSLETVDPELAWKRTSLSNKIEAKEARLNALAVPANSYVFEKAVQADSTSNGSSIFIVGGLISGGLLGLLIALTWARFSTKVLDEFSVGELLGTPVVGELPHYRSLARNILAAFRALPRSAVPVIGQLCVRSEAKAQMSDRLIVAVVGTQRGAGATTLALAMAEQFATSGSAVVLVDGDVRDPKISEVFNAESNGGIPSVISNDGALVDRQGISVFTKTMDPQVSVLGLGATRGRGLRRDNVANVLEAACRKAQIVVVDGGPALELASTIQLTRLADAVVLATPISRQKVDDLVDIGRQLSQVKDKLLPIITIPAKPKNSEARVNREINVDKLSIPENDKTTVIFE